MAKNDLDVSKLREEIDRRKSNSLVKNEGFVPKDKFLSDLRKSLLTGTNTESVDKIKIVANEASKRAGIASRREGLDFDVKETPPFSNVGVAKPKRTIVTEHEDEDREYLLNRSHQNKGGGSTLAEALEGQMKKEYPQYSQQRAGEIQHPQNINEQYLINKIDARVTDFLVENVGQIFTESMKSILLEQFSKEKLKEVLFENKDVLRKAVIEVIRDIQNKSKK